MNDGVTGSGSEALTEAEQALIEAIGRGEVADMRRRAVRGSVLRELILETQPGWTVPPAGVRIQRAIVTGGLDLEGCTPSKPLLLWHSRIESAGDRGALILRDARLKRLGIHSCTVEGTIVADRVEVDSGLFMGGGLVRGALQIRGGHVVGALTIDGTEIGDGTAALLGAGLTLSGPLIMRRARIKGEVALPRARLETGLYGEDAEITHSGIACNVEGARIGGDVLLDRTRITGALRLSNARIQGRVAGEGLVIQGAPDAILAGGVSASQGVNLSGAKLKGGVWLDGAEIGKVFRAEGLEVDGGETAISADVITIGGNWEMQKARLIGQLRCPGATVTGQLRLTEVNIFGGDLAIRADGARIRGGCFMSRATIVGLVRLPASEIGNQLRCSGATIKVDGGAALVASGARFGKDVELGQGFQTVGAVILDQAQITGTCDLAGSHLKSVTVARGQAAQPAPAATRPARPRKPGDARHDHIVLSLVDARVGRLQMPERSDERPRGIVDLSRASVGSFADGAAAWPPPRGSIAGGDRREIDHLVLDGFTYEHLDNPSGASSDGGNGGAARGGTVAKRRIAWLEGQADRDLVEHFKPQAWVQLAERLAAQGYGEDARTIAIARRRRERKSRAATTASRWQSRLLDWLALYGHNPWRTVLWMVATVLVFAGIFAGAARLCDTPGCFDESVYVITHRDSYTPETFQRNYPPFNALAYSLDVFAPVINLGYEDHWRPNPSFGPIVRLPLPDPAGPMLGPEAHAQQPLDITIGGLLYVLTLVETLLGIVLGSLAITGFTGILKGTE
jgi:hypothetical protein